MRRLPICSIKWLPLAILVAIVTPGLGVAEAGDETVNAVHGKAKAPHQIEIGTCADQDKDSDKKTNADDVDRHIAAALQWLADHQAADGSWNFAHHNEACRGKCGNAGTAQAHNAATAIVLLPFLAVGQTHQEGKHQKALQRGVDYLVGKAADHPGGVSFHEPAGNMYSHALATFALCEAYRQTKDKKLKDVCQSSLDFLAYAQDREGGGWRYSVRQPGDTSVGGWVFSALRTGQMAGLDVPDKVTSGASRFLDSVQSEDGFTYGYTQPGTGKSTTSIGLLGRIHLGGETDNKIWRRGVARIYEGGSSRSDMYFNFYATQLVAQRGGKRWKAWRSSINDFLIQHQAIDGHAVGSWHIGNGHAASRGGRLLNTSLATLVLACDQRQLGVYQPAGGDK